MTPYQKLQNTFRRMDHLDHISAMLQWDEAVVMPAGGAESRAAAMSELAVMKVEILKDPRIVETLAEAEIDVHGLSDWERSNLREMRRIVDLANAVDSDLVERIARHRVISERSWRDYRARNDWESFRRVFQEMVALCREEAQQRADGSSWSPYEAMMRVYEPDLTLDMVNAWFAPLRDHLPEWISKAIELQSSRPSFEIDRDVSVSSQKAMMKEFMTWLGFDFRHGRLDESHHPFCGGVAHDVRLTTRYHPRQFFMGLMGVLHETGHALYEQNRPSEWLHQPVSGARGMVIHESQSLFVEMQVGRSLEFYSYAAPILKRSLAEPGDGTMAWSAENLFEMGRRVKRDYIRVDANEMTYPLHVLLRFEIEQGLIAGSIRVDDVPDLWDQKMQSYLGLSTHGRDDIGCMQDVHWPAGLFGYFPCYTLGAMTAAQLFSAMERQLPGIRHEIERGQFTLVHQWLKRNIWSVGSSKTRAELMFEVSGEELNPRYFLEHLQRRYL